MGGFQQLDMKLLGTGYGHPREQAKVGAEDMHVNPGSDVGWATEKLVPELTIDVRQCTLAWILGDEHLPGRIQTTSSLSNA